MDLKWKEKYGAACSALTFPNTDPQQFYSISEPVLSHVLSSQHLLLLKARAYFLCPYCTGCIHKSDN